MKRSVGTVRRVPTAAARALALAAMLVASGLAASAASASGQASHQAGIRLGYTCLSRLGRQHVTAQVVVAFPAAGRVGKPLRPGTAHIALTIPHTTVSGLIRRHVRGVAGTAQLTTSIAQHGAAVAAPWPAFSAPRTALPRQGSLTLTASGVVPAATPTAPGKVTVTAAGLVVVIRPHMAAPFVSPGRIRSSPSPVPGPRDVAAGVRLECALTPGQAATLAAVDVTSKAVRRHAHIAATSGKCPPHQGTLKLNPRFPQPKPQPGAKRIHAQPFPGCAYVAGYADVRKLKGAALVGPALSDISENVRVYFRPPNPKKHDKGYLQLDNVLQLEYHGLHQFPPATGTFLSFGFVPTTATIHIIEVGTINAFAFGPGESCRTCVTTTIVYTRAYILADNVQINGVPLNVGNACETSQFNIVVTGSSATKPPYSIQFGGPLLGEVDVPHFSNCGVGENLDPIFDAAISGEQNFSLLTQGDLCNVNGGNGCAPKSGKPVLPKRIIRKVSE
jgi:hypothetical protein